MNLFLDAISVIGALRMTLNSSTTMETKILEDLVHT